MKTHVIQLDPHDDVISVRDKMAWAKTPRLVLVFPRGVRILARTLDLRLLQRHAAGLGAQLALVTRSAEVRRAAEGLNLPVFATLVAAQRGPWQAVMSVKSPRRRGPRPDLRRMRQEVFPSQTGWRTRPAIRVVLFTLAVLAVVGLFLPFFPSATVELDPERRIQSLTLSVNASPGISAVNLAGSLPAHTTFVVVETSETTSASGSTMLPDQPAQGTILFRNLTTSVIGIPAGTVVRTVGASPVRFSTASDGVVAAGIGKTVEVPAQALIAGSAGNLPAGALIAIEGELGASLAAANPNPTAGGTDRSSAIPTAGDRTRLRAALLDELHRKAMLQFQSLAPQDVFFPDTLTVNQVLSEVYIPGEGQPGSLLTLNMRLQYQAQYSKASDIRSLATTVLNANLPDGFVPSSEALTIKSLMEPVTGTDGVSRWQMQADRLVRARVDPMDAVQLIQGLKPFDAGRKLASTFQLSSLPQIRIAPSWWPWLPLSTLRVTIIVH